MHMSYRLLDFPLRVALQPVGLAYFLTHVLANARAFVRPVAAFWFYTTNISNLCRYLAFKDAPQSPSFTLELGMLAPMCPTF